MPNYLQALLEDDNIGSVILEANIVQGSENSMGFGVYKSRSDTNFDKSPYIKVFNGPNPNNCTKLARIDLKNVTYVIHYKDSPKPKKWNLSSKEKKQLNKLMKDKDGLGKTYWENIIIALADSCNKPISYFENMFPDGAPDFTKLP